MLWWLHVFELTKNDSIVHFKSVNCMVCESYYNKALQNEKKKKGRQMFSNAMQVDNCGKKKMLQIKVSTFCPRVQHPWRLPPLVKWTDPLFQEAKHTC